MSDWAGIQIRFCLRPEPALCGHTPPTMYPSKEPLTLVNKRFSALFSDPNTPKAWTQASKARRLLTQFFRV